MPLNSNIGSQPPRRFVPSFCVLSRVLTRFDLDYSPLLVRLLLLYSHTVIRVMRRLPEYASIPRGS